MITRHFIDVSNADGTQRRVHYRRIGSGPPVLLVHQSPRSSAEYAELMQAWAEHFTLIAPDTAGFGDSEPLPHEKPDCGDYADALVAFLDALGIERIAAYGFHSGAIILVTAAKMHADRFLAIACGGYAVWTAEEKADFGSSYTPPFVPLRYGEHLAWLWGRVLEQGWFFPWYRAAPENRLPMAHADPLRVQPIVMECLSAGDSFSKGYGAVLQANRDVPAPGEPAVPVLISAYDGDPLKAHLARLGPVPDSWRVEAVNTPAELEALALGFLQDHAAGDPGLPREASDEGFRLVEAAGFRGLVHWKGALDAATLNLHAPGSALRTGAADGLALDLPGHGLSDAWAAAPEMLEPWTEVVLATLGAVGASPRNVVGAGWSMLLAAAVAHRLGAQHLASPRPRGTLFEWHSQGLPDLTPDADGLHLLRAWRQVRAETFFDPWFSVSATSARDFDPADASPERLAVRHLALLQARDGRALLTACLDAAR